MTPDPSHKKEVFPGVVQKRKSTGKQKEKEKPTPSDDHTRIVRTLMSSPNMKTHQVPPPPPRSDGMNCSSRTDCSFLSSIDISLKNENDIKSSTSIITLWRFAK